MADDLHLETNGAASSLTSVLPRWLVISLTLVAFVVLLLFWISYFLSPQFRATIDAIIDPRPLLSLGLAVFCAIFFFALYPQEVVINKVPVIDLAVRVVGPVALMVVLWLLFQALIPEPSRPWQISDPEADFYLFEKDGEKYDRKFTLTDTAGIERLGVEPLPDDALKGIQRLFEPPNGDDKLYVKTRLGTYLGYARVADLPEELQRKPALTVEEHLRLGVYLGECRRQGADGTCEHRRDGAAAVEHLVAALSQLPRLDNREEQDGRDLLYYLMRWFDRCEQYDVLLNSLNQADPGSRTHAMAETIFHLRYRNPVVPLTAEQMSKLDQAALGYYLQYLGGVRFDGSDETLPATVRTSLDNAQFLAPRVLPDSAEVLEALAARHLVTLRDLGRRIEIDELQCAGA